MVSIPSLSSTCTEKEIKAFAEEHDLSYGEYPQFIIDLYERNPETRDFVMNYPLREKQEPDLSGYDRSQGVPLFLQWDPVWGYEEYGSSCIGITGCGPTCLAMVGYYLTGDANMTPGQILFLQWDPVWGYEEYGSSCIGITGCGPTCLAMVGYYLTGDANMTPGQIAKFAQRNGYYEKGYGSSWTLISEGGVKLGLTVQELPLVKGKITAALEDGKPVILALGPGDFTTTGHYVVLTGVEQGLTVQELPLVKGKITAALEDGKPVILALGPGDFTTTGHYVVLTGVEQGLFHLCSPVWSRGCST